jgi:hypothetical protein
MDRSLLSQPEVITASRQFVCVRLLTYENPEEMNFVKSLWVGRSGEVENTTVGFFAPDGKEKLTRLSRSFTHAYRSPSEMASAMNRIAGRYTLAAQTTTPPLPEVIDVRRAVNVAASDNQPLVIIYVKEEAARRQLVDRVSRLAWSKPFIGRFVYVTASAPNQLENVSGAGTEPGIFVVQANEFGMEGKVIAKALGTDVNTEQITAAFQTGLKESTFVRKDQRSHNRAGQAKGIFWETVTPVSDPQERMARERTKRLEEQFKKEKKGG